MGCTPCKQKREAAERAKKAAAQTTKKVRTELPKGAHIKASDMKSMSD